MCGIAGYIQITKKESVSDDLLLAMQRSIAHRGPDGAGIWKSLEHQVGFAHRRLSIIDLSEAGIQPMTNSDQSIIVCFNGEIYNYLDIRSQLEHLGYKFVSKTDTEVLIHGYAEWGISFLHKLEGMFAFALFDKTKNELFLVRDRIGIKPLYFTIQDGSLSFASEIKALWTLPWNRQEHNAMGFFHYLTFMVTPAPSTMYKDVYKLPAGFYTRIDCERTISFHEWYTPLTHAPHAEQRELNNEDFCIEKIRFLLRESTKKHMISDIPFGAFLSGGIDSSLNVALMAHEIKRVKTFTVAFSDEPESSELKWARLIAKQFDTDHHEILISEQDAFNFYEKMIYHLDEPLADPVCIPFYYVAKLAKDNGVTVAQVGEGSDELFFGYNIYAQYQKLYNKFWNPLQGVPLFMRKCAYYTGKTIFHKSPSITDTLHKWAYNRPLFWGGAIAFNERQKNGFIQQHNFDVSHLDTSIIEKIYKGLQYNEGSHAIVDYHLGKIHNNQPEASFIKQMTYLELKQRLPELLLMRADKMSMATSVEARVPFLDHKIVEFAMNIPDHIKFKNNIPKYILKKACEGIIPNEIIYRKKMGFSAPIVRWFNNSHQHHFSKLYNEKNFILNEKNNNCYNLAIQKWMLLQSQGKTLRGIL